MTFSLNRRAALTLGLASALPFKAHSQTKAKLIIVGGGFGGASAARTLRALMPAADITLIEAQTTYTACPFSNLVIGGTRALSAQEFNYAPLREAGVKVRHGRAVDVDPVGKSVTLDDGSEFNYDRLILSPGIDLRWNAIEGYDEAAAEALPHAWKAGQQTLLLRQQLESLEDGQSVLMSVPPAPYRCPPGPYERASLIAHYLKTQKPRSKLIILDAKDRFSKMDLFQEAWAAHYPDHLEWRGAIDDGAVTRVDAGSRTVFSDFGSENAAVLNIIPPQKAGDIAIKAGVADATGWCPINSLDFESKLQPDIHVIGDATIAAPMPKSAFSANLQAKTCAIGIARALSGRPIEPTVLANTCYSYTTPETAISIAGVYSNAGNELVSLPGAGGVSPTDADLNVRIAEAAQAAHWFDTITQEAFG